MGKSNAFDVSFPSELLNLCTHNMPAARTHLVSFSTSLCGRPGSNLISALSAGVRAYTAKKSKKKVCSDYLFENSCKGHIAQYDQVYTLMDSLEKSVSTSARQNRC